MSSKFFASALVLALAGAALPASAQNVSGPAAPQTAAARQPKPETTPFGDWSMRCFPVQSPAPCDVFQASVQKQTHQRVMSTSIAYAPSRDLYAVQFVVPLGVAIAKGLGFEAGSFKVSGAPFRRCTREGCIVESPIDPKAIQAMTTARTASLKVTAYGGKELSLPLSLDGFPAALAAMKAAAREKAVTPSQPSPGQSTPGGGK